MENKKKRLDYIKAYDKENRVAFLIRLNRKTDADIIERLRQVPNKQGYIKSLIRDDIEKGE